MSYQWEVSNSRRKTFLCFKERLAKEKQLKIFTTPLSVVVSLFLLLLKLTNVNEPLKRNMIDVNKEKIKKLGENKTEKNVLSLLYVRKHEFDTIQIVNGK